MKTMSTADAKVKFDELLDTIQREPVIVTEENRPVGIMLSGHGLAITDHAALIEKRLAGQDRRTEKIYNLVAEGHRSPHAVANAIWGDIALTQAYLTLSEVIGHLDILISDGRVIEDEGEKYSTFEAVS